MKIRSYFLASLFVTGSMLSMGTVVSAQEVEESESPFSVNCDLYNRYIWRGLNIGSGSPNIQPSLKYSKGGLVIGAWGAYNTSSATPYEEVDLYLGYTIKDMISITVTDYYLPLSNTFYNFKEGESAHLLEASIGFAGTEKIPFSLLVGASVYNDADNSIYVEAAYNHKYFSLFAGFGNGYYSTTGDFEGVNIGIKASREISITDKFSVPVNVSLLNNPNTESTYLVFGFSF